jgi:CPA2 family monovalent cation:H+ antiporter-2
VQRWIRARSDVARAMERRDDPLAELPMTVNQNLLTNHVVIVGYGRVGQRIAEALLAQRISVVVAEQNRELVEQLRRDNIPAVSGDASEPEVLIQAHIARAHTLVIAIPDTFSARKMIEIARTLKPNVRTVVRTHSDEEARLLRVENAGEVFIGEHELAQAMTRHVIETVMGGATRTEAAGFVAP